MENITVSRGQVERKQYDQLLMLTPPFSSCLITLLTSFWFKTKALAAPACCGCLGVALGPLALWFPHLATAFPILLSLGDDSTSTFVPLPVKREAFHFILISLFKILCLDVGEKQPRSGL